MQVHELEQAFAIDGSKTVIIDAGGAMIKWKVWDHSCTDEGSGCGFKVSGGATLCILNATLDGQQKGRAVSGTGTGTDLRFVGVTFQNCTASVRPPFSAQCLILLHSVRAPKC